RAPSQALQAVLWGRVRVVRRGDETACAVRQQVPVFRDRGRLPPTQTIGVSVRVLAAVPPDRQDRRKELIELAERAKRREPRVDMRAERDRKSTRLNSSH